MEEFCRQPVFRKGWELFTSMPNDCYKYDTAINAKGQPFPAEPLIMALLLSQHKMIDWLTKQISKNESLNNNNNEDNVPNEENKN